MSATHETRAKLLGLGNCTRLRRLEFAESGLSHDSVGNSLLVTAALSGFQLPQVDHARFFLPREISNVSHAASARTSVATVLPTLMCNLRVLEVDARFVDALNRSRGIGFSNVPVLLAPLWLLPRIHALSIYRAHRRALQRSGVERLLAECAAPSRALHREL